MIQPNNRADPFKKVVFNEPVPPPVVNVCDDDGVDITLGVLTPNPPIVSLEAGSIVPEIIAPLSTLPNRVDGVVRLPEIKFCNV